MAVPDHPPTGDSVYPSSRSFEPVDRAPRGEVLIGIFPAPRVYRKVRP